MICNMVYMVWEIATQINMTSGDTDMFSGLW